MYFYFSNWNFTRSREYEIDVLKKLGPIKCIKQTERGLSRFVKAWVLLIQNKCEWMNNFKILRNFPYFAQVYNVIFCTSRIWHARSVYDFYLMVRLCNWANHFRRVSTIALLEWRLLILRTCKFLMKIIADCWFSSSRLPMKMTVGMWLDSIINITWFNS